MASGLDSKEALILPLLDLPGFFHFFGTKELTEDRAKETYGNRSVRLLQVHGDTIVKVSSAEKEERLAGHVAPTGDALMTDRPGILLTIFTSDCLPVIIIDPNHHAVAIAHAGWRGSFLGIAKKTVAEMTKAYHSDPSTLLVGMGHRIGPCCFEVGAEVWQQVKNDGVLVRQQGEKGWIDLARLNHIQLVESGVKPENIADADICTACHKEQFNSYRRDHIKGQNMVSGVVILC